MFEDLNKLIEYIEDHLSESISTKELAKRLGISEYHLKRTFSFIAGVSLNEYIKNRRLSCANIELIEGEKITNVAYKYGYKSIEGFSRAFREFSGFLPSHVKKNKWQRTYPKLTLYINIKGGVFMDFKIEDKQSFNIVGVSKKIPIQFEGENKELTQLINSITDSQKEKMRLLGNMSPYQVINASYDFDDSRLSEKGNLTHMIGYATTKVEDDYKELDVIHIPALKWATFPIHSSSPNDLQEKWGQIFSEWLPNTNYELVKAPEISFTKHSDKNEESYSEIWIAIKDK